MYLKAIVNNFMHILTDLFIFPNDTRKQTRSKTGQKMGKKGINILEMYAAKSQRYLEYAAV